ncbi:hypothetical protein H0H81_011544 [Sphagnurus paluster]|uniref:CENP-C homolog n=1 Tax=Sphagnurus paluster TaxID=117069 RepID=A0A9P7GIH0_9AGAR|nr:hypothetical protein H0H81_011544 [Sphagnurus paluster]
MLSIQLLQRMMAETPAGPSTIPVITVSNHNMQASKEDTLSPSSSASSLTKAQSTPLPKEPTEQGAGAASPTQDSPVKPKRSNVSPPRTESGAPDSLKRSSLRHESTNPPPLPVDDQTPWYGTVVDYGVQRQEISRVVVFPSKMVYAPPNIPYRKNPTNKTWTFQKTLADADFLCSGFLFIQVNGEKETKHVHDNSYVFLVIEGAVEATIHHTSYAISTGGVFLVPRGNTYSIRNICDKDAKLIFTQARRVRGQEDHLGSGAPTTALPSSKSLILIDWLLQRAMVHFVRLRTRAFAWYWRHLARYRHWASGRRLYFLCFLLGLMIRRLPFIGSPPILNLQLIRVR